MQTEEYAKMREQEDHYWWFVARRKLALDLVHRHHPEGGRILDVGCGTGALLERLQTESWASGVDFSPYALDFSSSRNLKRLALGDAQKIPYMSHSFDTIISLDTIEHVPDDKSAVKEIHRVLKPGGVFIMNVPAFMWLWGPHDVALMHHRRYTAHGVRSLLTEAGLEVISVNYSVFLLFPVVMLRRLSEKFQRGPAEVRLPTVSDGVNRTLGHLMDAEAKMARSIRLPYGSSVVAVARRRT